MTTKIDLKQYTITTLTDLKKEGSKVVIEYLSEHVPDVTIQKVNGWLRSGKFPPEVYEAVFANEAASAEPGRPAQQRRPQVEPEFTPEQITNANPPASSEYVDPQTEETLTGNMVQDEAYAPRHPKTGMPVQLAQPVPQQRVVGKRHTDIRIREARERGREGIEQVQAPITSQEDAIARGVELALQRLGLAPQNGQPRNPQPIDPGVPPPKKVRGMAGDNWNTPKQPQFVVQQR